MQPVYRRPPAEQVPVSGTLAPTVPRPTALFPAPRLRDLRLARRLSQARLGELAHVARDSISNLEANGVARADTIERLARALQVEPDELMRQPT